MARRVAIVGAGPSGLAACKAALEEQLVPVVFERASGVGGLWRGDGQVWTSLRTNLSKYTCAFSDSPWPDEAPDFPAAAEVCEYLSRYADASSLLPCVRLGTTVVSLRPLPAGKWLVESEQPVADGKHETEEFDFVIVASGIFSKPHRPSLPGQDEFRGSVLHASDYREPQPYAGKRVLVVGAAFSGADIAVEIAAHAACVTVASRRPLWHLPRYIGGKPADLAFYSRAAADKGKEASEEEKNLRRHKFFASITGELPAGLATPDPEKGDVPFVALTDGFREAVQDGRIKARAASLDAFVGELGALFSDGHHEEFDVVLFASGYRLHLPLLSPEALLAIGYSPEDWLQPALLHECVWHPELKNLAFAGIYRGPYFAVMELQARWACGVFSGRLLAPTARDMERGLQAERRIREQRPRPQFPHGDYVGMAEALAELVGVHPREILDDAAHELRALLYDGPLLPFHYRLAGFGSKPEVAEAAIRECVAKYPVR